MFEANRKIRKPTWVNLTVLALLLLTNGFILSACQKPAVRKKSEVQKEKPVKVEQQKSGKQLKGIKSTKSQPKKADGEDSQDDDDPE